MRANELSEKENFSFADLLEIVSILRSPDGCPWDREQDHKSLRNNFVEEAYEVCEGIDKENNPLICEELGDVLLQIVFHAQIAKDEDAFTIENVIDGICKKMILRHPHIFSDKTTPLQSWEEIKRKEKGEQTLFDTLSRVSTSLPSLKRAEKFIKLGAPDPNVDPSDEKSKFGLQLYKICFDARAAKIDPEEALNSTLNEILEKCTNCE